VLGLVIVELRLARRVRRQGRLLLESFEAVQLRQWDQAREALVPLLHEEIRHPRARVASLLALAAVLEAEHNYEGAQRVYESVLEDHAGDPIQLHTARVALAAAMLRTGQITDAISLIDRLMRLELTGSLKAQLELLSLFREVTMGQAAEGLEKSAERRKLFRAHMGTRAGYGYALLASAYDLAGRREEAQTEWRNATLLVRPADLIDRFPELKSMTARYPAAEHVL
jgi:tetratricopeptide (TPR) repeat protein